MFFRYAWRWITASSANRFRALRWVAVLLCLHAVQGCALSPSYYWQAAAGQWEIWQRARPFAELRADPSTPAALRARLVLAQQVHDYAVTRLGLPAKGFRSYADLQRSAVVWNVFATPPLSLQAQQWCLPVAGCVAYLAYFSEADAHAHAARLAKEGLDTWVAAVPAYSTLGWFEDPVLNTWINWPDYEVARLVFHELAHQVAYVRDDSAFNESFASVVEEQGVKRWLAEAQLHTLLPAFERSQMMRAGFIEELETTRAELGRLYASAASDADKLAGKALALRALKARYAERRASQWAGAGVYDRWFSQPLNNASVVSVGIYQRWVPAFERLLAQQGGDFARFYAAVQGLAAQPAAARLSQLQALEREADAANLSPR